MTVQIKILLVDFSYWCFASRYPKALPMKRDEFLNPKSMLTPGIAGGIVMLITNTLLNQFGLEARWTALILSFLLALVVFLSVAIPAWQRAVFYFFNALIIFSVAAGTNQVGTATKRFDSSPSSNSEVSALATQLEKSISARVERKAKAQQAAKEVEIMKDQLSRVRSTEELARREETTRGSEDYSGPVLSALKDSADQTEQKLRQAEAQLESVKNEQNTDERAKAEANSNFFREWF